MIQLKNMQKLKLSLITTTFVSLFCLLSILSFGQNAKNTAPELNAANSKNTGMRINHNANAGEIENSTQSVQKLWVQGEIGNSDESFAKLWKNEPFGEQNIAKELVEKRDAYAKHFANDDGSISAHIASGPIHYKEKNEWKTIFHTITPTANGFENIHNSHKTYYPASATESLTTVLENGEVLRDMINMNMYFSVNGEKVHLKTIQDNKGRADFNQLTYPNAYGNGIDLQLTHETTKRKMDYVIHNREAIGDIPNNASHLVFEETIELPIGWNAELKDNIIYIKDGKGEIQVLYEKPFLEDSPNFDKLPKENITEKDSKDLKSEDIRKINLRDEGEYSIKQNGNLLTIQTAVTIDWITSEERQFPVKVDPTVNVKPNNTTNWIRSVYDDGDARADAYFGRLSGYFLQSYIKFNTSSIPTSSIVNSVTGYINIIGAWGAWNGQWQFANSIDPTVNSGLTLYNSANLGYSQIGSFNSFGLKSSTFYNPEGNAYVQSGVANGFVFAAVVPSGSYNPSVYYQFSNQFQTEKPYLRITYTASSACSGTPTGGTASITPSSGTHGSSFTASVSGSTAATGITYQWESAPSSTGPWTAITSATLATYVANAPYSNGITYYRRKITCTNTGGGTSYSTVTNFTTTCIPSHTEGNCAVVGDCQYVGISNVNMGTINNTTSYNNPSPAYNYYSSQSTELSLGTQYSLKVKYSDNGYPTNLGEIGAWIDWNNDGDFSDENEFLGVKTGLSNNATASFNFNVPVGTSAGDKRMRVRSILNGDGLTSTDACTIMDYGETEDYSVNVLETVPIACTTPVSPLNGATGVAPSGTLNWNASAGATSYNVYFGTDNPPATMIGNTANMYFDVDNMDYNTTYSGR